MCGVFFVVCLIVFVLFVLVFFIILVSKDYILMTTSVSLRFYSNFLMSSSQGEGERAGVVDIHLNYEFLSL